MTVLRSAASGRGQRAGLRTADTRPTNGSNGVFEPQRLVLDIRDLPSIPGLIADTLRVVNDPSASGEEMEWVVSRDQALTARVLRVANSPCYGFVRRIETVREAVVILGTRKLKHVAASLAAAKLFVAEPSMLLEPQRLWTHALAASLWAGHIIERQQLWGCASAVTASLLHDLGVLVLWQCAADRYEPVLEEARELNASPATVEAVRLGTTHAQVGGMLCARWQLPVSVTQLVSQHHTTVCPCDSALGVVILADHLAHAIEARPSVWWGSPQVPEGLMKMMGSVGEPEFFESRKRVVLDQVAAFHDAVNAA